MGRTRRFSIAACLGVAIALGTPSCSGTMGPGDLQMIYVGVTGTGSGSGRVVSTDVSLASGALDRLDCVNADLRPGGDCSLDFEDAGGGGTLFVTAFPDPGSEFAGWTGRCAQDDFDPPDCDVRTTGDAVALEYGNGRDTDFILQVAFELVPEPEVGAVTIAPASLTLTALGPAAQSLIATVRDTDGEPMQDVPLSWASDRENIVGVTPVGMGESASLTAVADGEAVISATAPNGISGAATVTVTAADVPDEVIFSDMEVASEWFQVLRGSTGGVTSTPTHPATEGFEGAFRRIQHDFPGAGTINTFHGFTGETYDPSTQGAIASLRFSEYRRKILPVGSGAIGATFAIQQSGVIYPLAGGVTITNDAWEFLQTDELTATDFTGGTPDFTATGGPITFGFIRSNTRNTASPNVNAHGVDNFRVEVRR